MTLAPDSREPLNRMLNVIRINDSEMRQMLSDSAVQAERIIARAGSGLGGSIRAAQLDLAAQQRDLWAGIEEQVRVGIGDGVDAAGESASLLTETMFGNVGMTSEYLRYSVLAQARTGIDSIVSRGAAGKPLEQSVYNTSVAAGQQLDRTINAMLLNGASAREMATAVRGFVDPFTPGGASYAAMRLARTEINNAFHTTSVRLNNDSPFVEYMKWNLSSSHPRPDECDDYAHNTHMRKGEPGVFHKAEVPSKPHPQCFCYVTPVTVSDEDFVKNFHNGTYDEYIDGKLGCSRG